MGDADGIVYVYGREKKNEKERWQKCRQNHFILLYLKIFKEHFNPLTQWVPLSLTPLCHVYVKKKIHYTDSCQIHTHSRRFQYLNWGQVCLQEWRELISCGYRWVWTPLKQAKCGQSPGYFSSSYYTPYFIVPLAAIFQVQVANLNSFLCLCPTKLALPKIIPNCYLSRATSSRTAVMHNLRYSIRFWMEIYH